MRLTWAPRFHPFLDQSQWPEYDGPHIVPDPELMVPTKGRRRKKRFRGDMDDLAGYTGMKQFGSGHFMEAPDINSCGKCDEPGHNVRKCTKKPRTDANTPDPSQSGARRGGTDGTRGGRGGGGRGSRSGVRGGRTNLGSSGRGYSMRGRGGRSGTGGRDCRTRRVDRGRPIDILLNPDG